MISVLLPSRARVEMARKSIESLGDNVEVLIWVDDDDQARDDYRTMSWDTGAQVFVRPRVGYPNMHKMVNLLARKTKGDWLLLWNDDALMHTQDWQAKLPELSTTKPQVLNIFNSNPEVNLFPLINRKMYETMGHYSLSAHCDSWVQDIGNKLGIHQFVPDIEVEHLRERINDETKQHSQGSYASTSPKHSSPEMVQLMEIDIKKLKELL